MTFPGAHVHAFLYSTGAALVIYTLESAHVKVDDRINRLTSDMEERLSCEEYASLLRDYVAVVEKITVEKKT